MMTTITIIIIITNHNHTREYDVLWRCSEVHRQYRHRRELVNNDYKNIMSTTKHRHRWVWYYIVLLYGPATRYSVASVVSGRCCHRRTHVTSNRVRIRHNTIYIYIYIYDHLLRRLRPTTDWPYCQWRPHTRVTDNFSCRHYSYIGTRDTPVHNMI